MEGQFTGALQRDIIFIMKIGAVTRFFGHSFSFISLIDDI